MPGKRRDAKPAPVFFVPPARAKPRDKKSPGRDSGETKEKVAPVFFQREHKLPELNIWSGWEEDMPPEYFVCPSCLTPPGDKHLKNCPRPDMKRIGWHCPACDAPPRNRHAVWCPRNRFQDNPYAATAYTDSIFLDRVGFEKQIIIGHGHPTPLVDSEGRSSLARIKLYLAAQRNEYSSEPWRLPTLRKGERAVLQRVGDDFESWPDDESLPF